MGKPDRRELEVIKSLIRDSVGSDLPAEIVYGMLISNGFDIDLETVKRLHRQYESETAHQRIYW